MTSTSKHSIIIGNASSMSEIASNSTELIVSSPPYPMIEMWDDAFIKQHPKINQEIINFNGRNAFELMHSELDKVWKEIYRVLIPGGFACINIGDATRTLNKEFALYSNHSRIISAFLNIGMQNLPNIIWRKQTNAPNKFMGSGMLPAGAYITLEHEWILIFRKGGKRIFNSETQKEGRRKSAYFWEERNIWFSDIWELKGTKQAIDSSNSRKRSAAFPFEIPYRLINMFSVKGDTILDPFLGTGTTTIAAIASNRNSIGYEIDSNFHQIIHNSILNTPPDFYNNIILNRLDRHKTFLSSRTLDPKKSAPKHFNKNINMPVITAQETGISIDYIKHITTKDNGFVAEYCDTIPVKSKTLTLNL